MDAYERARKVAVQGIENAIIAHNNEEYSVVEKGLEEYEMAIPRNEIEPNTLLFLTLEFWSCWADSANHGYWEFYPPIGKNDFPRLAAILLNNLTTNTEVTNEEIKSNFSVFPSNSLITRLKGLLSGNKPNK